MSRRSTRLKDVQRPKIIDSVDDEDVNISDAEVEMERDSESDHSIRAPTKSRGKKRKAAGEPAVKGLVSQPLKKARGKRGILKELVEMPMDILYEIFGQLEPYDLLNLARTTKAFRELLMSKSSIVCWKDALSNVPGLPPCPDDLNEPQYTELAFGKHCYICQRNVVSNHLSWSMRLRVCTRCLETSSRFSCNLSYIDYRLGANQVPKIVVIKGRRVNRYFDCQTVDKWEKEYRDLKTQEEKFAYYPDLKRKLTIIDEHSKACSEWAKKQEESKVLAKAATVESRKAIVVQWLRDLGWGEELDQIDNEDTKPQNLPSVVKACQKDITERVLENLKEELVTAMEKIKHDRLTQEHKDFLEERLVNFGRIYTDYLLTLPADVFYPTAVEIFFDSEVKRIIDESKCSAFTEDEVALLNSAFPLALARWRQLIEEKAAKLIQDCMPAEKGTSLAALLCEELNDETARSILPLALTTFHCRFCKNTLSTKHAIIHYCARDGNYILDDDSLDPELTAICHTIREAPWNALSPITFNEELSGLLESTLVSCGFPPRITAAELDQLDPIFECLQCNSFSKGRLVMKWYTVAQHLRDHQTATFCLVSDTADATRVRERMKEEAEKDSMTYYSSKIAMCTHCRHESNCVHSEHLLLCHDIKDPELGVDFILSPRVRPCLESSRLWPGRCKSNAEATIAKCKAVSAAPPSNKSNDA